MEKMEQACFEHPTSGLYLFQPIAFSDQLLVLLLFKADAYSGAKLICLWYSEEW